MPVGGQGVLRNLRGQMIVSLTKQDVERLLVDPSAEARADTARKIAEDYQDEAFTPEQREMVEEVFGCHVIFSFQIGVIGMWLVDNKSINSPGGNNPHNGQNSYDL